MKTSSEMASHMLTNPDGGTFALDGSDLPTTGYYVGGLVSPLIVDDLTTEEDVALFIDYLRSLGKVQFVGWWTDIEDGTVWVDGTSHMATYIDAEVACKERGERAFYDIERGRSFTPIVGLVP